MKAHIPVYRPILKHALKTAWIHRELWPLAAVAGLAGTGAVVNDVLNQAKIAVLIPENNLGQAFKNWHLLGLSRNSLLLTSPGQLTVGSLAFIVIAVLAILVVAASQQVILKIVHQTLKRKSHIPFGEVARAFLHPSLLRFLSLDLFLKLFIANLMIVTTLALASLNMSVSITDAAFGLIFAVFAIWLALLANLLIMLALIGVTSKNMSLGEALVYAWRMYRSQPYICFEMSALLFAANFVISIAYDCTIVLLGVPAALGFVAALQIGSFLAYFIVIAVTALVVVTVTVAFAGFATTFTYSAWTALAEKLGKKSFAPRIVAHSQRLIETLRS